MSEPLLEFEQIVEEYHFGQTEEALQDQWREEWLKKSHHNSIFRAAVIDKVVELTGVKTGKEFFSDGQA